MPKVDAERIGPKQYLQQISRRAVYGSLVILAIVATGLFLLVPHYKPLKLATSDDFSTAHRQIIKQYFVTETTCKKDSLSRVDRVKTFNAYFKVNGYANRAVIRGCNDADTLLAKNDAGDWFRTDVKIMLSDRQDPQWQKACLIDDITTTDTKVRLKNTDVDANNLKVCDSLVKQSYIDMLFH